MFPRFFYTVVCLWLCGREGWLVKTESLFSKVWFLSYHISTKAAAQPAPGSGSPLKMRHLGTGPCCLCFLARTRHPPPSTSIALSAGSPAQWGHLTEQTGGTQRALCSDQTQTLLGSMAASLAQHEHLAWPCIMR